MKLSVNFKARRASLFWSPFKLWFISNTYEIWVFVCMHACMYGYVCEWAWSVVEQRKEVGECAPRPASWRRPPERWSTWSACTSRPRRTRRRTSLCPESAAAACSDVCESTSKNNLAPQRATQNYVTITSHDHANCSQAKCMSHKHCEHSQQEDDHCLNSSRQVVGCLPALYAPANWLRVIWLIDSRLFV